MAKAQTPRTVEVTTTAGVIAEGDDSRRAVLIKNIGASTVFLGGTNAVASSGANEGWELAAGETFPDTVSTGDIYGIVASGTCEVKVWEVF